MCVCVLLCFVLVGKPAPDWNGTAVVNGEFVELRLADFKGDRPTSFLRSILSLSLSLTHTLTHCYCRKVSGVLFLSS